MSDIFTLYKASRAPGKVFLVGAGPGDPDLLTLKADRLLQSADVVVFDNLVGSAIIERIPARTRKIYAGKESGRHSMPQAEINRLLVSLATEGLQVVRLKGGDPFIFGRGGEEIEELVAAGIGFEVVPGITAAAGVAAYAGFPLTHREHAHTLVFTTGHLRDGSLDLDWPALARPQQTVVIYMGLAALPEICRRLIDHGLPPETLGAVVQQASTAEQRDVIASLAALPDAVTAAALQSPALIVIGSVVALHERMRWFRPGTGIAAPIRQAEAV